MELQPENSFLSILLLTNRALRRDVASMIFNYRLLGLLGDEFDQPPGWVFKSRWSLDLKSLDSSTGSLGEVSFQDASGCVG